MRARATLRPACRSASASCRTISAGAGSDCRRAPPTITAGPTSSFAFTTPSGCATAAGDGSRGGERGGARADTGARSRRRPPAGGPPRAPGRGAAASAAAAPPARIGELRADTSAADYFAAVERILAYLVAGDAYQVNLARRLSASIGPAIRSGWPRRCARARRRRTRSGWGGARSTAGGGRRRRLAGRQFARAVPARRRARRRRDPPDQGDAAARRRRRQRSPPAPRAADRGQGARRARHDRRSGTQRSGTGLRSPARSWSRAWRA